MLQELPKPRYRLLRLAVAAIFASLAMSNGARAQSVPALSSNADAEIVILLDFDGHYVEGRWNPSYFAQDFAFPPFDLDGAEETFSEAERLYIFEVWATVAEDFAPFDVNVTTVEPLGIMEGNLIRVNLNDDDFYFYTDGKAGLNSFNDPAQKNLVFARANSEYASVKVGTTASHEIAHSIGLRHQVVVNDDGVVIDDYHDGSFDVGPIMGVSTGSIRKIWWSGSTVDAYGVLQQDDLAVLSREVEGIPYRSDDHSNSRIGATRLLPYSPGNTRADGIIERTTDVDCFEFTSESTTVSFEALVDEVAPNLEVCLELWKTTPKQQQRWGRETIEIVATSKSFGLLNARLTRRIPAGTYVIAVKSRGNYGDIGQYQLRGSGIKNSQFTPSRSRR